MVPVPTGGVPLVSGSGVKEGDRDPTVSAPDPVCDVPRRAVVQ